MDSSFVAKLKEDLDIYRNFSTISNKLDKDGYLLFLVQSIDKVFSHEISYAVAGNFIRSQKDPQAGKELSGAQIS